MLKSNKGEKKTYTVFPHIVSTDTILFWIWKSKGHSTYIKPKIAVHKSKDHSNFEELTLWNLIKSMNIHSRLITYLTFKNKTFLFMIQIKTDFHCVSFDIFGELTSFKDFGVSTFSLWKITISGREFFLKCFSTQAWNGVLTHFLTSLYIWIYCTYCSYFQKYSLLILHCP